ncbi:hypothetical protein PSP31121_05238 [Pandoraea sputorum]|uniref:Uncharacterized protein n=2 Tax=Pandoraea sputorum TaxID=93222 RepID=A0A5E5BM84_9BURK|nr:hypothetical protein PSP31121_05238 [Pandoraea sputorum]
MTTCEEVTAAAIAAFARREFDPAVHAKRAEAADNRERDPWISHCFDAQGGATNDAAYEAWHAQGEASPAYAQHHDAVRQHILAYFGVTDEPLHGVSVRRANERDARWAELNPQRRAWGGKVRGDR